MRSRMSCHFLQYALFAVSLPLAYHTPTRYRVIHAILQLTLYLSIFFLVPTSTPVGGDYFFATSGFFGVLRAFDYFVLSDCFLEFRRPGHPTYSSLSPSARLKWILDHTLSTRGIGYTWEAPYLLPSPRHSRLRHIMNLFGFYLLQDIGRSYLSSIPFMESAGAFGKKPSDYALPQRAMISWAVCLTAVFSISMPWTVLCILRIWGRREDEKPMLGRWGDAYTLRRFWGRVWHQNLRRSLQTFGRWVAWRVCGFERGGTGSSYCQLYVAFALCAIGHWAGNFMVDPTRRWTNTVWFFLAQAVGITMEDFVIWLVEWVGYRPENKAEARLWKYVGYIWVAGWFAVMLSSHLEESAEIGLYIEPEGLWSPTRGLLQGRWFVGGPPLRSKEEMIAGVAYIDSVETLQGLMSATIGPGISFSRPVGSCKVV